MAFASATSQQKKLLQSKLYNEGVLLSLLAFNGGSNIVQLLADGEAGSASSRGVYSWLFPYIHIYKKTTILEDFIKN